MTQSQRPGMEPMISALFMTMLYLIPEWSYSCWWLLHTVESHIRQVTQARRDFEKAGIILKMRKMVKKPLAISKK